MEKFSFIPPKYRPSVPGSLGPIKIPDKPFIWHEINDQKTKENIFVISARDDIVAEWFYKLTKIPCSVKQLYYDDLGLTWDFSYTKNKLKLYLKDGSAIEVCSIYHRHPGFLKNHPFQRKHIAFFEVLDIWSGTILGQKRDQHHNSSKAYQCITTIKEASVNAISNSVRYPKSFFFKGKSEYFYSLISGKQLIVKSNSSIRSEVVDNVVFSAWNLKNLQNVPTLFQEKIDGIDVRTHLCEDGVWTLKVLNKNTVDYRYSHSRVKYENIDLPDAISAFCRSLAKIENNNLVGIDLINVNGNYFCLEINPGPGWSTFSHQSRTEFAEKLLYYLRRTKYE